MGARVKTWPKHEVIGLSVIATVVVGGMTLLTLGSPRPSEDTNTYYEVDVFSGRPNPGWGEWYEGGDPILDLFVFDEHSGVRADPPGDLGFRGVILTGADLPGGDTVRSIRVVEAGYYVEYVGGKTQFIEDAAVWPPIRAKVEFALLPAEWIAVEATLDD